MTETATEAKVVPVPLDEFGVMAHAKLATQIGEYNDLVRLVKAADGDPQSLLDELRKSSDDPTVVKINAKIDELNNTLFELESKRDEILKPLVSKFAEDAKASLGDKPEKMEKLGKTIKTARAYLADTYCPEVLDDLPPLEGKRGGGGGGAGSGARRIRGFDFYVDGKLATTRDAKGNESSNAAAAAKALNLTTEDIRQAFWAAAGTDDSSKYPPEVKFTVTISATDTEPGRSVDVIAKRVATEEQAEA
jgi:hypothetical protein